VVDLGLLITTGAISLDLYLTGYRTIPAISRLFLLQVIAAFGLGLAALGVPSRLAAAGGSRRRPRRLPAGLDRAVRIHRAPHDRPHRRRPGGGGRFHGPGRRRIVPGTPWHGTFTGGMISRPARRASGCGRPCVSAIATTTSVPSSARRCPSLNRAQVVPAPGA